MQTKLDDVQDERDALEAQQLSNKSELESLRNKNQDDLEGRYEKLEESRRALLAAQRLSAQDIEDKIKEIANLEKQKKNLQAEVEDLKARLESEVVAKGEEASGRRKLATELKECQVKLDAEIAKSSDLSDSVALFKSKADQSLNKLELVEVARIKVFTLICLLL